MARPPETPGKPATERITIRLNPSMLQWVDAERGAIPRAAFVRQIIRQEAKRRRDQPQR